MPDQDATMQALHEAIEAVLRANGTVPDGFYIGDWAVVGAAQSFDEPGRVIMFATPGNAMAPYQLHGLLDLADRWIVADPMASPDDYEEDDDDGGN
jgi:ABC-type sugar transport system substrate-binding protein